MEELLYYVKIRYGRKLKRIAIIISVALFFVLSAGAIHAIQKEYEIQKSKIKIQRETEVKDIFISGIVFIATGNLLRIITK